jgi:hypothetical protein
MLQYLLAAQRDSSITSGAGKLKPQYVNNKHVFTRLAYETGMIMPVDDKEQVNALLRNSSYSSFTVSNTWDVSPSSVYSRIYR